MVRFIVLWFCVLVNCNICMAQNDAYIVVLDVEKILQESDVAKFINGEGERKRVELQKRVENSEKVLREKESMMKKEKDLVHSQRLKEEFEKEVIRIQQKFAKEGKLVEEAFGAARDNAVKTIMEIISDFAVQNKIDFIIPKNFVIFHQDRHDVTDQVLKIVNAKISKVDINIPILR